MIIGMIRRIRQRIGCQGEHWVTRRSRRSLGPSSAVRRPPSVTIPRREPSTAHAVLVVLAATHRSRHPPSAGLIGLTCNEAQHLLATLLERPAGDLSHRLRWSLWRRRHQARARICHYRRQANQP
jgi:hypothetical protein